MTVTDGNSDKWLDVICFCTPFKNSDERVEAFDI